MGVGYVPPFCDPWWYVCYPGGFVPVDYIVGERTSTDFGVNFGGGVNLSAVDHLHRAQQLEVQLTGRGQGGASEGQSGRPGRHHLDRGRNDLPAIAAYPSKAEGSEHRRARKALVQRLGLGTTGEAKAHLGFRIASG